MRYGRFSNNPGGVLEELLLWRGSCNLGSGTYACRATKYTPAGSRNLPVPPFDNPCFRLRDY